MTCEKLKEPHQDAEATLQQPGFHLELGETPAECPQQQQV